MTRPAETLFLAQNMRFISTIQLLWTLQGLLLSPQQSGRQRKELSSPSGEAGAAAGRRNGRHLVPANHEGIWDELPFIRTVKLCLISFNITKNTRIYNFHAIGKLTSVALL